MKGDVIIEPKLLRQSVLDCSFEDETESVKAIEYLALLPCTIVQCLNTNMYRYSFCFN